MHMHTETAEVDKLQGPAIDPYSALLSSLDVHTHPSNHRRQLSYAYLEATMAELDEKHPETNTSPASSINIDDAEVEAAGYRRAMPRQFSTFSLMSLGLALTATWLGIGSSLGIALTEASAGGAVWGLLVAAVFTGILATGIAELASAYPIAGAQYYWTFMVSSEESAPFAAFFNGWMSVFSWWLDCSAVANLIAGTYQKGHTASCALVFLTFAAMY